MPRSMSDDDIERYYARQSPWESDHAPLCAYGCGETVDECECGSYGPQEPVDASEEDSPTVPLPESSDAT